MKINEQVISTFKEPMIVEKSTLERLANKMVSIHFSEAKAELKARLKHIDNMEDYIELLEKEVSFYNTIDQVLSYEEEISTML